MEGEGRKEGEIWRGREGERGRGGKRRGRERESEEGKSRRRMAYKCTIIVREIHLYKNRQQHMTIHAQQQ